MLGETLRTFRRLTKHPEHFLESRNDAAQKVRNSLKQVYDHMKEHDEGNVKKKTLPKLIIENFDDEQIWQELELHNSVKYDECLTKVSNLLSKKDYLSFHLVSTFENDLGSMLDDKEYEGADNTYDGHKRNRDVENEAKIKAVRNKKKGKKSVVDDKFFKLSELEEFLKDEDQKDHKRQQLQKSDLSDSESIDYFQETASSEEEEGVFYNGFFDPPEEMEDISDKQTIPQGSPIKENDESNDSIDVNKLDTGTVAKKKVLRFDLSPSPHSSDESDADNKKEVGEKMESSLDVRQKRLQARIAALEKEALNAKPWQMKGEVDALSRPQNSLLEEILEFDMTTRPAPLMTEQTTFKLEDLILHRIKDKAWDDVERKVKPVLAPEEYKKKVVMNHEKSKLSLAEVYEQEYLQKKAALNPIEEEQPEEEPQEHRAIRSMMSALFAKLDALTNFQYTPKMVIPEVKIVSNLPAITMEEVIPVATADSTLLAPKEVKAKKRFDPIAPSEQTVTDKKRKRRIIKKKKRLQQKEKEKIKKVVEKLRPGLGNKYSKEKTAEALKELGKAKNVEQVDERRKTTEIRSSTAFFGRLEEQKSAKIKTNNVKKVKKDITAKKLKL